MVRNSNFRRILQLIKKKNKLTGRFGMGAALAGTMKKCISIAIEHANRRVQFGKKIGEFGLIQEKISHMAMRLYATEAMAYMLSSNMDRGSKDYQIEAAICKIFASESAWYVCDETIQVLGGMGFMKDAGVERILRDLRIFRIFEGTNDILRLFVAGTGLQTTGEELKQIQQNLKGFSTAFGVLKNELNKRLGRSEGLTGLHSSLSVSSELIGKASVSFGLAVQSALVKHKKAISEEQLILKRIADIAIGKKKYFNGCIS